MNNRCNQDGSRDRYVVTALHASDPIICFFLQFVQKSKEACYKGDSYSIGCFSTAGEFDHHILPSSPEEIVIKMHLNTRKSEKNLISTAEVLDWRHTETLDGSSFDPKKPTVIFTHGFRTAIDKHWLLDLVGVS